MSHHPFGRLSITLLACFFATASHAQDTAHDLALYQAQARLLENANGQNQHWNGIGRLQVDPQFPHAHCTAALMDTRGREGSATGPAYVLTAGHCVTFNSLNATVDLPSDGYIDFNYFHDSRAEHHRVNLKTINLGRLGGHDIAIIELDSSLQGLLQNGIQPLQLADSVPEAADELVIVGVPSQYPESALRIAACTHVSTEWLIEQPAILSGFYKNHCSGLKPGSSGSPLLDRQTNRILGVVSTSTFDTLEENRCFENTPCEVQQGQAHWAPHSIYSSPTYFLDRCFSAGHFTPGAEGCDAQPWMVTTLTNPARINYYRRVKQDSNGLQVLPSWKFAFSLDKPFYRYKAVREPQQCASPHFYSAALSATEANIDDPVGPEPGLYLLCIIGIDSADQVPELSIMKNPLMLAMEVAEPGPTTAPIIDIRREAEGGYTLAWHFSTPRLSAYKYKAGKPETTDCTAAEGYVRVVEEISFAASELPLKLCTLAYDMSGQPSLPRTDLLLAQ